MELDLNNILRKPTRYIEAFRAGYSQLKVDIDLGRAALRTVSLDDNTLEAGRMALTDSDLRED